jgi:hypothetical protein
MLWRQDLEATGPKEALVILEMLVRPLPSQALNFLSSVNLGVAWEQADAKNAKRRAARAVVSKAFIKFLHGATPTA